MFEYVMGSTFLLKSRSLMRFKSIFFNVHNLILTFYHVFKCCPKRKIIFSYEEHTINNFINPKVTFKGLSIFQERNIIKKWVKVRWTMRLKFVKNLRLFRSFFRIWVQFFVEDILLFPRFMSSGKSYRGAGFSNIEIPVFEFSSFNVFRITPGRSA